MKNEVHPEKVEVTFVLHNGRTKAAEVSGMNSIDAGSVYVTKSDGIERETKSEFKIYSYIQTDERIWYELTDDEKNEAEIFENGILAHYDTEDKVWKADKEYYWPTNGECLSFFCYTPADIKNVEHTAAKQLVFKNYSTLTDQEGILLSAAYRNPHKDVEAMGPVQLEFINALAGIQFLISYQGDLRPSNAVDQITDLYITGVATGGTLYFGPKEGDTKMAQFDWEADPIDEDGIFYRWEGSKDFTVQISPTEGSCVYDGDGFYYVLPQELPETAMVHFKINGRDYYDDASLKTERITKWEPGSTYTYFLVISSFD